MKSLHLFQEPKHPQRFRPAESILTFLFTFSCLSRIWNSGFPLSSCVFSCWVYPGSKDHSIPGRLYSDDDFFLVLTFFSLRDFIIRKSSLKKH